MKFFILIALVICATAHYTYEPNLYGNPVCPTIWDPVCTKNGFDYKIYENPCRLKAENLRRLLTGKNDLEVAPHHYCQGYGSSYNGGSPAYPQAPAYPTYSNSHSYPEDHTPYGHFPSYSSSYLDAPFYDAPYPGYYHHEIPDYQPDAFSYPASYIHPHYSPKNLTHYSGAVPHSSYKTTKVHGGKAYSPSTYVAAPKYYAAPAPKYYAAYGYKYNVTSTTTLAPTTIDIEVTTDESTTKAPEPSTEAPMSCGAAGFRFGLRAC